MFPYRLIALDLDGTLNNNQKQIAPGTREFLKSLQQQGTTIALASARPTPGLSRERSCLDLDLYHGCLISHNGARILDAASNRLLFQKNMDPADVTAMLTHLAQFPVSVMVDDGSCYYTNNPGGYKVEFERKNIGIPLKAVDDMAAAVHFPTAKILVVAPEEVLSPLIPEITGPFRDTFDFFHVDGFYLEIVIKNLSKADGLAILSEQLAIPREQIIAFGDSANDIAMLEYAGLGVAMANAGEAVKKAADAVTSCTNDEEGVTRFLEEVIASSAIPHVNGI